MNIDIGKLSVEEKRALLKKILDREKRRKSELADTKSFNLEEFAVISDRSNEEVKRFSEWKTMAIKTGRYGGEVARFQPPDPYVEIQRQNGEKFNVINFSTYNYLGYSNHPEVINAAKRALDKYGLGATASPLAGGILGVHREFEETLLEFFGLEGYGIALFTSGYGALVGVISAYMKPGDCVIADSSSHASIVDGMIMSGAKLHYFLHNDMEELEDILKEVDDGKRRILVCCEGVYSAEGDYGKIKDVTRLAKKYGAYTLVDEAHSMLLTGNHGRGACDKFGLLDQVDMIVGTFSKSFSGVGGFVWARKEIADYVNIYARNRMFSCALDPAVTAGMRVSLKLAMGPDGDERRERLWHNANYLASLLRDRIDIGETETWMVPVIYGADNITAPLTLHLQEQGVEGSVLVYPGVPKNRARVRLFITSEHTDKLLKQAAEVFIKAGEKFNFLLN